ncbi:flagellar biosynthetic protein FliQ [Leptolyngbya valderiana BDU 20041]|nr:flagellar biosynthetic protein FliQ [Leptolyngbya valderiana BDU 20041]
MEAVDVIAISREAIWVSLKVGGPALVLALVVGLVISLIQALTQMQEMTLSFVPKILVLFVALALLAPFMLGALSEFTVALMDRIVAMG